MVSQGEGFAGSRNPPRRGGSRHQKRHFLPPRLAAGSISPPRSIRVEKIPGLDSYSEARARPAGRKLSVLLLQTVISRLSFAAIAGHQTRLQCTPSPRSGESRAFTQSPFAFFDAFGYSQGNTTLFLSHKERLKKSCRYFMLKSF